MNIHLIEDEAPIRKLVQLKLNDIYRNVPSYRYSESGDLHAAANALLVDAPDVILLDLGLKTVPDGTIEHIPAFRDLGAAVVVLTGYSEAAYFIPSMQHGACDYIEKEIFFDQTREWFVRHVLNAAVLRQSYNRKAYAAK